MYLTWLDSNTWLIELANKRVLVDPWLVGPLVFGNLNWLFKGKRRTPRPIPQNIDLIVLSQGLEDHAHPPTLKQLDKNIPVVASPNAAKVVRELGFVQITTLPHGETFILDKAIEIRALPGAPIGPFLQENAYIFKDLATGRSVYYEPHGYPSPRLEEFAPVDAVITPVVSLTLPVLGPLINGADGALKGAKLLQPQVILPTAAGGDVEFEGLLLSLLREKGSVEELKSELEKNNLSTEVMEPKAGDRFRLKLSK
ncbi:MAG: MBL fold metallo-hydrolase [Okeania sp. SIO2H7]|nr:MBL fold metallo-hydrolase [Okeania sp. SIO2H7]